MRLAEDLWGHLDGRDVYVVGAANIGKSTLTDALIDQFLKKNEKREWANREASRDRYGNVRIPQNVSKDKRLEEKRFAAIRQLRVTKSSLPGTTLQNIRVPCFPDHTQALWDTPGLLMDTSSAHFPVRNLDRLKALRPTRIEPQDHVVNERSLAFLVVESDDADAWPLLHVEARLRKDPGQLSGGDPVPIRLVWNSTLNDILSTKVMTIEAAREAQRQFRAKLQHDEEAHSEEACSNKEQLALEPAAEKHEHHPDEDRAARKERRRRKFEERVQSEKEKLGMEEWQRREAIRNEEMYQQNRLKKLASFTMVLEGKFRAGRPMEIDAVHFGSVGFLADCDCLVRVFAPSTGVQITERPMAVVPPEWQEHAVENSASTQEKDNDDSFLEDEDDRLDHPDESFDDYENEGFSELDDWGDEFEDFEENGAYDEYTSSTRSSWLNPKGVKKGYRWSEFSGENVGWQFDAKPRFVRGALVDGWHPIENKQKKGKQRRDGEARGSRESRSLQFA